MQSPLADMECRDGVLLITCPGHPEPSVANNRILGHYSDAIPIRVTGMGDSPMALTWVSGSRDSRHAPTTQEQHSLTSGPS